MRRTRIIRPASASTIDSFSVSTTPSLIGFWPCNDTGATLVDRSQYGHNITISIGGIGIDDDEFLTAAEANNFREGWFTLAPLCEAKRVATGTPLDTQAKVVVVACEFFSHGTLVDLDCGTAHNYVSGYSGFMLGGQTNTYYFRVAESQASVTQGTGVAVSQGSVASVVGAYVPSTHIKQSVNGGAVETKAVAFASLVAQDGKFGFGPSATQKRISLRNYQLWAFDAEPSDLDTTVQWMSAQAGKIPPWWEGT